MSNELLITKVMMQVLTFMHLQGNAAFAWCALFLRHIGHCPFAGPANPWSAFKLPYSSVIYTVPSSPIAGAGVTSSEKDTSALSSTGSCQSGPWRPGVTSGGLVGVPRPGVTLAAWCYQGSLVLPEYRFRPEPDTSNFGFKNGLRSDFDPGFWPPRRLRHGSMPAPHRTAFSSAA